MPVLIAKQGWILKCYFAHQASSCQCGLHDKTYEIPEKAMMEGCIFGNGKKNNKAPKWKNLPDSRGGLMPLTGKGSKLLHCNTMRSWMTL